MFNLLRSLVRRTVRRGSHRVIGILSTLALVLGLPTTGIAKAQEVSTQEQAETAALVAGIDPENILYLQLPTGRVVIQMRPDLAPNHVRRIRELVRQGFYDNVPFHRVIAGFMAQTGDPSGTGRGGSGQNLVAEFSSAPHVRGVVSMARAAPVNSADSQFFIMYAPQPSLNGKYTVWGQVLSGMEHVDSLKKGDESRNGMVENPERIISMRVASDVDQRNQP